MGRVLFHGAAADHRGGVVGVEQGHRGDIGRRQFDIQAVADWGCGVASRVRHRDRDGIAIAMGQRLHVGLGDVHAPCLRAAVCCTCKHLPRVALVVELNRDGLTDFGCRASGEGEFAGSDHRVKFGFVQDGVCIASDARPIGQRCVDADAGRCRVNAHCVARLRGRVAGPV